MWLTPRSRVISGNSLFQQCNSKVHHRVHNSPPLVLALSHINLVYDFPSCFKNISVLPSMPGSSKWSFYFWVSHQKCRMHVSVHMPRPPNSPSIFHDPYNARGTDSLFSFLHVCLRMYVALWKHAHSISNCFDVNVKQNNASVYDSRQNDVCSEVRWACVHVCLCVCVYARTNKSKGKVRPITCHNVTEGE